MNNPHVAALYEMFKEAARLALFAALAAISGYLTNYVNGFDPDTAYYIVFTIVLRLIDRFIHTNQSARLKDVKGLAWF